MTDGKCRNQNKYLFPVATDVQRAEGDDKQNVVISILIIEDVILTQTEIQLEIPTYEIRKKR